MHIFITNANMIIQFFVRAKVKLIKDVGEDFKIFKIFKENHTNFDIVFKS